MGSTSFDVEFRDEASPEVAHTVRSAPPGHELLTPIELNMAQLQVRGSGRNFKSLTH